MTPHDPKPQTRSAMLSSIQEHEEREQRRIGDERDAMVKEAEAMKARHLREEEQLKRELHDEEERAVQEFESIELPSLQSERLTRQAAALKDIQGGAVSKKPMVVSWLASELLRTTDRR